MLDRESLIDRNNRIIEIVKRQIEEMCPGSVDLIGIGGSFCNGDIYDKSDLDLVIIVNDLEKASVLNKCFILGDIGYDVYTTDWTRFESSSKYKNPYVTKLFDLDIVYTRDDSVMERYLGLRETTRKNMSLDEVVFSSIREQATELVKNYMCLEETGDLGTGYRLFNKIITNVEFIIYMLNRCYVKRGTKRVPEEIASMKILPTKFLDTYNIICNGDNLTYIKAGASSFMMDMDELLSEFGIEADEVRIDESSRVDKQVISADGISGTYEEIYSNWKNKMYHAVDIDSNYLSFRTMASCQEFYDEMAEIFDIPRIELLVKYNPSDLKANAKAFDEAMADWKKLYDEVGLEVQYYNNLEELENLYSDRKGLQM